MSAQLEFITTPLAGLLRIDRHSVSDHRGFLNRLFCAETLKQIGYEKTINQINHTLTRKKGTVRGLHFQYPPHTETKIVTCVAGEVFDVAVDLRQDSATFLHWHAEKLSAENHRSLFIPDGFAHGFQTLSEDCQLIYFHSAPYTPAAEGALNVVDPKLGISWPIEISELSDRDRQHPFIDEQFSGVVLP